MAPSAGDAATAAAAATVPRYPAWVLLEKKGYNDDRDDAASASCRTATGRDVKVAFYLAPPPEVSYFCVHLSKLEGEDDFDFQPVFLFSAKGLALFRFLSINRSDRSNLVQYLIYNAGRGSPSLQPIPPTPLGSSRDSIAVGIVPCPDDGEDSYVLADLSVGSEIGHYNLHVYSSKTCKWNTTPLQLPTSPTVWGNEDLPCRFHKVIVLGADELGWVDLWCGIVTCKVLDNDPVLRLIPLPKPQFNTVPELAGDVGLVRDVTYCNGLFKLVEVDHFSRPVIDIDETSNVISKRMKDFDSYDIIHDSELSFPVLKQLEPVIAPDGWKIYTYLRFPSRDYWLGAHAVHVDDISNYDPKYSKISPQWDAFAEKSTLRNLITDYPTFGIHGDNVVYLISKLKPEDDKIWIVGVDIEKKMLRLIEPYTYSEGGYALPALLPSTFSYYLNTQLQIHGDSSVPDMGYDPLSCAGEATSAPSGTCNFEEINQVLSSDECSKIGQTIILQSLRAILMSSGSESGYLHPTMKPVLKTKEDGKLWLFFPLGHHFSKPSGPELKLLNSLMAQQSMLPASLKNRGLNTMYRSPNIPIFAEVLPVTDSVRCRLLGQVCGAGPRTVTFGIRAGPHPALCEALGGWDVTDSVRCRLLVTLVPPRPRKEARTSL